MKKTPITTVDRISTIALRLLESGGPEAVTMRAVAKLARITPMAIYHHFPNREALLEAITNGEFDRVLEYVDARRTQLPKSAGPTAHLLTLMHGQIDYAVQRPQLFDYVFSRNRSDARRFPEDFHARRSPTMNPVADGLRSAMTAGWLKHDDPWEIAMQLTALIHGYLVFYRGGRFSLSEKEFRALCERAMSRMFLGLNSPSSKSPAISASAHPSKRTVV